MDLGIVVLFGLTSFLASALLFSAQPMIGKMLLPALGGTPAVWNTCLVFFQGTLLCGYLVAHAVRWKRGNGQARFSGIFLSALIGLLAAAYLVQPLFVEAGRLQPNLANDRPVLALLSILCESAMLPLVMVSAIAPLLQRWFSLMGHPRSQDPYFLYAASNAGSLLALLAYPFVVEPNIGLMAQSHLWRAAFLILAALVIGCALTARQLSMMITDMNKSIVYDSRPADAGPTFRTRVGWILLVGIPASWLMSVTAYITTDLAAMPLMWIIPLALYLLSFVLAFSNSAAGLVRAAGVSLPYLLMPLVLITVAGFVHAVWISLHLMTFFVGSLSCHRVLAQMRPPTSDLSSFYVTIALGGLLAGIGTALVAPLIFDRIVEYPLALIWACPVAFGFRTYTDGRIWKNWLADLLFAGMVCFLTAILVTNQAGLGGSFLGVVGVMIASGLGLLACVKAQHRPARFALVLAGVMAAGALAPGVSGRLVYIERSFFGVVRVTHDAERNVNRLFHGTTLHGQQSLDPALGRLPSTYFTRSGPVGQVFSAMGKSRGPRRARVAIVGLGAGTLAAYAQPGERWTFYEIDPAVLRIARDPQFFTYLRDCEADAVDVILGDARQRLEGSPKSAYQMIVLDAFSSDALPVHLLSREAIRLYRAKLAAGGLLLFNLSNRYVDLDPVIGRQAADAGLVCRLCYDTQVSEEERQAGKQPSIWAVMAANEADLGSLAADPRWQLPTLRPGSAPWTDDYSDLASYLLFSRRRSFFVYDQARRIENAPAHGRGNRGAMTSAEPQRQ